MSNFNEEWKEIKGNFTDVAYRWAEVSSKVTWWPRANTDKMLGNSGAEMEGQAAGSANYERVLIRTRHRQILLMFFHQNKLTDIYSV